MVEERFSITHFPGGPWPVPRVLVGKTDTTGPLWTTGESGPGFMVRRLPWEFFIRDLLDSDIDSDEGLRQFVAAYGVPWISGPKILMPDDVPGGSDGDRPNTFTPDHVRHMIRLLRALVRHWVAHTEDEDVLAAWRSEGFNPPSEPLAWMWWSRIINELLSAHSPYVIVEDAESDDPDAGDLTDAAGVKTLEACVGLQLANAVEEALTVRRCQNETCGRYFQRQAGTAEHGQHRTTGVKYCTNTCARAHASRVSRRRAKKKAVAKG